MTDLTPANLVAGSQLAFDVTGTTGPAIVQLHGLTSSRQRDADLGLDMTAKLRDELVEELPGGRILRYDARAHGRSSGLANPEAYRWPALAHDLLALLDHVFPGEAVHAIGPSMGAATQLWAAVEQPERLASLSLMLPPTAWETRAARADQYEVNARLVENFGIKAMVDRDQWVPPPAAPPAPMTHPDVDEHLLPSVFRGAALSNLPSRSAISRVPVPVLILAWVDDPGHPESTANELHRLLPTCSLALARTPQDVARWPSAISGHIQRVEATRMSEPVQ